MQSVVNTFPVFICQEATFRCADESPLAFPPDEVIVGVKSSPICTITTFIVLCTVLICMGYISAVLLYVSWNRVVLLLYYYCMYYY